VDDRIVGTWRLDSYHDVQEGTEIEGPLGAAPEGLLLYGPDGHMAVSMMGTGARSGAFMGYAGTWRHAGDRLVHRVAVSSHGYLVGTAQEREVALEGDRLVLAGTTPPGAPGASTRRLLRWQRVG
jgi:hypothetical protein